MAAALKEKSYLCGECGHVAKRWSGKCESCGAWNVVREFTEPEERFGHAVTKGIAQNWHSLDSDNMEVMRVSTGYEDVDRVLGGGLVAGSAILIGGDPGVGKSTMIMQVLNALATNAGKALYVSGEEAVDQVRLRARRLGLANPNIMLVSCTNLHDILATALSDASIRYLVVDSIQTVRAKDASDGGPGSAAQVRQCAQLLTQFAKTSGVAVIIIGHITKDGAVAGPKLLEHMVDAVLYFEGEKNYQFRILRSIKNRYGPSNEIGIFCMTEVGLEAVLNPSALFAAEFACQNSGSIVFAAIEGNRPLLVEVQALVAPTYMTYPRRTLVGWDSNRLDMILAILHTRYKLPILDKEIYLNIVGGIRIQEPGADLAVAMAIISAANDFVFPKRYVAFGEIGLGGEIRPIAGAHGRVREAVKIGFRDIVVPKNTEVQEGAANVVRVDNITDLKKLMNDK